MMALNRYLCLICMLISLFTSTINGQASTYTCAAGSSCMVDCTNVANFECNTKGTGISTINAVAARDLTVFCYEPDACAHMLIECPITQNTESFCVINCDLGNSCNSLLVHTHNTTNVTLLCGANELDRNTAADTQCTNITIDGNYGYKGDNPPPTQNITIVCNDENYEGVDTPTCSDIKTRNVAQMGPLIPNSVVTLNILCTVDWAGEEQTQVCDLLYIDAGKAKYVNLYIEGDLTNSHFNLTDLALLEVTIDLLKYGTVWNTTINAPQVQNKFYINSSSIIGFLSSHIIGPYVQYQTACEIETYYPSRFEASTFEGRFYIHGDGWYLDSVFNAKTAGYVDIQLGELGVWERNKLIIEDSNASLVFFGLTSGYVDARNSAQLSVICKSKFPQESCVGLVLEVPPYVMVENIKKQRAFLECIDYGCTNITTISENGADDIAVTAVLCDCEQGGNGESGNSCIGQITIGCGESEANAVFDGEHCHGSSECCGPIAAETTNALCNRDSGSNGLNDWEVVGVFIGVLFGVLLLTSLFCYCTNQSKIRDHIKRTQATNPYTQTIVEEEQKANTIQTAQAGAAGYGSVTDEAV